MTCGTCTKVKLGANLLPLRAFSDGFKILLNAFDEAIFDYGERFLAVNFTHKKLHSACSTRS